MEIDKHKTYERGMTLHMQFIRFAGVGVLGTSAHYLVLIVLVHVLSVDAVTASMIGFVFGATVNYFLNYHYTFFSNKSHRIALPKFFIIAGIGALINGYLMTCGIDVLKLNYLLAQMMATSVILFWNFFANRLWTF